uniref:RNase NYN domain-containing protein n=1 Tax=Panagrellus redivivus TaxID=6233 RepID=A0A7E4ZS14_PANRE
MNESDEAVNVYSSRTRYFGSVEKPTYAKFVKSKHPVDVTGLEKRIIIIDGMDILDLTDDCIPGTYEKKRFDCMVILQLIYFFDYHGFKVTACFHEWYIDNSSNSDILHELIRLGFAYVSGRPGRRGDECEHLNAADSQGAVLLTNNSFDHHWNGHCINGDPKLMFCKIKVDNPNRPKHEWARYTFQKPIEHFYFLKDDKPKYKAPRYTRYVDSLYDYNETDRIKLRNLWKFVSAVSWYQMRGEYCNIFPEEVYGLPIEVSQFNKLELYAKSKTSFKPNKKSKNLALRYRNAMR